MGDGDGRHEEQMAENRNRECGTVQEGTGPEGWRTGKEVLVVKTENNSGQPGGSWGLGQ